jgi:competence protein ComEA
MGELLRPPPPRTWRERLAARTAAVSPSRVASGAGAVLLVAVTAWWLLRPGALPVEAGLPRAGAPSPTAAPTPPSAASGAPTPSPSSSPSRAAGDPAAGGTPAGGTPAGGLAAEELVVQAAGAVVRPGVYRLPGGARVRDLVDAAGGPMPEADLDRVALAARLTDGQRVLVPRRGDPAAGAPPPVAGDPAAGAAATDPVGPLDLNAASAGELDRLPGVGPATAAAIVAHRDRLGPFRSVDELTEVPGIGPAKLAALRDLVRV